MNKKLICLLLSLLMVLSVCLTACGTKTDEEAEKDISDQASVNAMTLVVHLMSDGKVEPETVTEITDAVNKITETKFKTRLVLKYFTEDEYFEQLEASYAARDEAKANGTDKVVEAETEAETYVDEDGVVKINYPTVAGYQVDIFYMGGDKTMTGEDRFNDYLAKGMLSSLGTEVDNASKKLKEYISPQYLAQVKSLSKGIYAIPNNKAIGEYTYLLLNKEAMKAAYRSLEDDYSSLTSDACQDFLEFIQDNNALKEKYLPIYTNLSSEELLLSNLHTWSVDSEGELNQAFSVLGDYYKDSDNYLAANTYPKIANLFENEQFIEDLTTLKEYELNGYIGTSEEKECAIGYVKGTAAELVERYGDRYEMVVVESPRLSTEDLYSDMLAVSSFTSSVSRSMEIVTLINTDAEFRNLLLYGIEDKHYQVIDTGVVKNELGETYKVARRLNEEYMMDLNKTGNTLIAYPLEGSLININDYAIKQNQDAKVELTLGFTPTYNEFVIDNEKLQAVQTLSDALLAEYRACDTMEKFEAFLVKAKADVAASAEVQHTIDADHGIDEKAEEEGTEKACEGTCGSLGCSYQAWLKAMKIVK
ncbi:MAG: hypothetical protein IJY47_06695 [Clostridia bacterium]|nr:hypothetical protein [Clostridia bacterium]